MDKKVIRRIPERDADEVVSECLKSAPGSVRYIISAEETDGILVMRFYATEDLAAGRKNASFRTFHTQDDYISQDLRGTKSKWYAGGFETLGGEFGMAWGGSCYAQTWLAGTQFRDTADLDTARGFFGIEPEDPWHLWNGIFRAQEEIRAARLKRRHDKELEHTDALMAAVQDAPEEFYEWVWDKGMADTRYLIYRDAGKGIADIECCGCGCRGSVKRSEVYMRNNKKGTCPFCKKPVTFKAAGLMAARTEDYRYFCYVDPTEDGFLLRVFEAWRKTRSDAAMDTDGAARTEEGILEVRRAFYTFFTAGGRPVPEYTAYELGVYKQRGPIRWCPDTEKQPCWMNVIYPGNLPEAWAHTPMKYSALEVMAEATPTTPHRYEPLILAYCDFPHLEWIIKMGLYGVAGALGERRLRDTLDMDSETIFGILRLTKEDTRLLQKTGGSIDMLRLLQEVEEAGTRLTEEGLMEYYGAFGTSGRLLRKEERKASLHKICRYIEKESAGYPAGNAGGSREADPDIAERLGGRAKVQRMRNLARDWMEYLGWCAELGRDTGDLHVYLPSGFKAAHDRTAAEVDALRYREKARERRKTDAEADRRLRATRNDVQAVISREKPKRSGLVIAVPESGAEIRAYGEALHDCLGAYVDKVAKGECQIFFILRAEEPDKPYFALEWRDGRVAQCRGKNNCGMTREVEAFVEAFEKKMQEREAERCRIGA